MRLVGLSRGCLGLVLFGSGLIFSSCRQLNPSFSPEQLGTAQEGSTVRVSTAPDTRTDGVFTEETNDGSDGSTSSEPGGLTSSQSSDASGTTSTSQTSMGSTSSAEQTSSGPPQAQPLCGGSETYCYAMNYDANAKSYPDFKGQGPPLEMVEGEGSLSHQSESGAGIFENYLRVDNGGRVRVNQEVPTGFNGAFGFDVTVRDMRCDRMSPCYLGITGELVLQFEPELNEMLCVSFLNTIENGRATASVDPKVVNNVACFAQGNTIYLIVNGQTTLGDRSSAPASRTSVRFNVGASTTRNNPGKFLGDIGRFRYWKDPLAMQRVVKAGN